MQMQITWNISLLAESGQWDPMLWGGIGIAGVLVLGGGLLWFRHNYHPDRVRKGGRAPEAFSMDNIEELRRGGMISDEEFRSLRITSLGLDIAGTGEDNSTLSAPRNVDDAKVESGGIDTPQDSKESQ